MPGEEDGQSSARSLEQPVQDESQHQELQTTPGGLATITATTTGLHPLGPPIVEPIAAIGPPPAYQDIYPTQPHYWNGQIWPPPPPVPPPVPPPPWSIHSRTVTYYNHSPSSRRYRTIRRFGTPNRVPSAARWFFGTVTFMMIFSIVSAFVYVLIVTANVK